MSLADISVSLSLRDRLGGSRHYLDIINEDIGIDMDEGTNSIRPGGNLDVVTEDLLTDIQATDSGDWNDPFPIQSEVSRNGVEDMA
jgi:hypothetical protein